MPPIPRSKEDYKHHTVATVSPPPEVDTFRREGEGGTEHSQEEVLPGRQAREE